MREIVHILKYLIYGIILISHNLIRMNKSYKEYSKLVQELKKECAEHDINDEEFKKLYLESLESVNRNEIQNKNRSKIYVKKRKLLLMLVLLILTACSFKYIYNNVICNLQELIYPGLRLIRKMSIPFISLFPALTGLFYYKIFLY